MIISELSKLILEWSNETKDGPLIENGGVLNRVEGLNMVPYTHYVKDPRVSKLILEHKQLRLSRIGNMSNDKKDGQYVIDVFHDSLKELNDEGRIGLEDYERLSKMEIDLDGQYFVSTDSEREFKRATPYVLCFSDKDTLDDCWE
ncbi:MAG: hypothetical protein E7Z69_08315 [Thermoplasmata archaeon]|nr:hypothetical protein [Thermoplasmata archaeon]